MKGSEIRSLRQSLGLEVANFAQLLGVHTSTLYRWEASGDSPVKVEPFQQQLLAVMQDQASTPDQDRDDLGETILKGLLIGGAMFGLYKLLEAAFSEERPRRTGGAVARDKSSRVKSSPTRKRSSS